MPCSSPQIPNIDAGSNYHSKAPPRDHSEGVSARVPDVAPHAGGAEEGVDGKSTLEPHTAQLTNEMTEGGTRGGKRETSCLCRCTSPISIPSLGPTVQTAQRTMRERERDVLVTRDPKPSDDDPECPLAPNVRPSARGTRRRSLSTEKPWVPRIRTLHRENLVFKQCR